MFQRLVLAYYYCLIFCDRFFNSIKLDRASYADDTTPDDADITWGGYWINWKKRDKPFSAIPRIALGYILNTEPRIGDE